MKPLLTTLGNCEMGGWGEAVCQILRAIIPDGVLEEATERKDHWLAQELDRGNLGVLHPSLLLGMCPPSTIPTVGVISRR